MNALRNIFNTRGLTTYLRYGQNAFNSAAVVPTADNRNCTDSSVKRHGLDSLLKSRCITDATKLPINQFAATNSRSRSVSPSTLKRFRRLERMVELVYRCKLCNTRNKKMVTEAAYTTGVVILQCDGCSVNHLIIDNLGWFVNTHGKNFSQVLSERSNHVMVIKVNQNGDLI